FSGICRRSPCISSGYAPSWVPGTGSIPSGVAVMPGAARRSPGSRRMPENLLQIIGVTLACSLPVVLVGALALRALRDRSLTASMAGRLVVRSLGRRAGRPGGSGLVLPGERRRSSRLLLLVAGATVPAAAMLGREQGRKAV